MQYFAGTSSKAWQLLALLVFVQRLQAAPLASPGFFWEEQHLERARALHPTCDHDHIMHLMQQSCQSLRRRRRDLDSGPPLLAADAGAEAGNESSVVRVARSSPGRLFSKCCLHTCIVDDFVGVCP